MRRFNIVVPREDGGVEVHPMKEWLRHHPGHLPAGVDASAATSHKLRDTLKQRGWQVEELSDEVRLFLPGTTSGAAVEALLGADTEGDEPESAIAFGLEAQLRDFIAHNLKNIPVGGRNLKLYVDPAGRDGVEYPTDVGFIDILAQAQDGGFVVFELKLQRGPDRALGQLARYMGWIKQRLSGSQPVHGAIVARTIDSKLRYAASVIPNVTLLEYEVQFQVREAKLEQAAG